MSRIEVGFSGSQWKIIERAFKEHRRQEESKGVRFDSEGLYSDKYLAYTFTFMCDEWSQQQDRLRMVKNLVKKIKGVL